MAHPLKGFSGHEGYLIHRPPLPDLDFMRPAPPNPLWEGASSASIAWSIRSRFFSIVGLDFEDKRFLTITNVRSTLAGFSTASLVR